MKRLFLYAALLLLTQCSKCKDDPKPKNPEDELPAATQEGKNTFGCLVNGQAYTPQGYNGSSNFIAIYEPDAAGNVLNMGTYRITDAGRQYLNLSCFGVDHVGHYSLDLPTAEAVATYTDDRISGPCGQFNSDRDLSYRKGRVVITRLDVANRVVAGTFEVTFARPGCDTVRITQGRFDAKL